MKFNSSQKIEMSNNSVSFNINFDLLLTFLLNIIQ